jgi:hypothetical protein
MIGQRGAPNRLHKQLVVFRSQGKAAQIEGAQAIGQIGQRHQILAVVADEDAEVIHGILLTGEVPLQFIVGNPGGNGDAVINAGFDFAPLFIVVPGHKLNGIERMTGVVKAVDGGKGAQPGLAALLLHESLFPPTGKPIIEALVGGADGLQVGMGLADSVEILQIADAKILGRRFHPGIAAGAQRVLESAFILENEHGIGRDGIFGRVPVNFEIQVHVEIAQHRAAINPQVGRGAKVGALDILQVLVEGVLGRAQKTGIPLDGAGVHDDGEGEARMPLGLLHELNGGAVVGIVGAVPVNEGAFDAPADHVFNLAAHLVGIGRVVSHVHVFGAAKPGHQVGVDFGLCAGIEKRMQVNLADIRGTDIAVGLVGKMICGAGVVGGQRAKRGGRLDLKIFCPSGLQDEKGHSDDT